MLHRIELPFEPNELASIFALQMELLQLAGNVDQITPDVLNENFDDQDIVEWLTNSGKRFGRLVGPLNEFIMLCPDDQKRSILDDLQHDYGFWKSRKDEEFSFSFNLEEDYHQVLANWLIVYFDQFKNGVDEVVTKTQFINKGVWEEAFKTQNPDLKTCPFCDGSLNGGVTIEHFLPKSKYPVLSVHVANLIPCCENCNGPKGDNDPLDVAPLPRLFIPYDSAALEVCDVIVDTEDEDYTFLIQSKLANERDLSDAIGGLEKLFQIPQRWNEKAGKQAIIDLAYAKIEEQIEADKVEGMMVGTIDDFRNRVDILCNRMERFWGKQHLFVPATSWLRWANANIPNKLWDKYQP